MFFKRKRKPQKLGPHCACVVAAAGSSARMGGTDKLMAELDGQSVISRTLQALNASPYIHEITVVTREELLLEIGRLCRDNGYSKVTQVLLGGESRLESVYKGVCQVSKKAKLIAIHDGARPFVTVQVIEDTIAQAAVNGAAAPAVPVKDTVKEARGGTVERTLERENLYAVQTPQVFDGDLIRAALQKALEDGAQLTDDCAAVERMGMKVVLTAGDERNIKLTTPTDLLIGEAFAGEAVSL